MEPINPISFQIITKEISIINNNIPQNQFKVSPQITRSTGSIDETHAFTEVTVEINNTNENPFPVNIKVCMMGVFELTNIPENSITDFLEIQAVQIILPYIRAIITNLTSAAFMPPLVLPVFDVRSIFQKE